MRCRLAIPVVLLALGAVAITPTWTLAAGVVDRCYSDWSEAAAIVRSERLVLAGDVQLQSRARALGEIVRMTLCEERGRYTYRLVVRRAGGLIEQVTVDARKPF